MIALLNYLPFATLAALPVVIAIQTLRLPPRPR
jgi:MFS superfamily sulfate permease-like transporter